MSTYELALESSRFIQSKLQGAQNPQVGIVLGSGLGDCSDLITNRIEIPFEEVPHFKKTTIEGHDGILIYGQINGVPVICMKGRYHFYEGHSIQEITFPVKVFKLLNVNTLILTNSSGGINEAYEGGDLVLIRDHINFFGSNPLIGINEPEFGPRFPDISNVYSPKLIEIAKKALREQQLEVKTGVYGGVTGPSYETVAEVQMFKTLRVDLLGSSTVPEAIVAAHMNMQVLGISCVTCMATGISKEPITHESVIQAANVIKVKLSHLLKALFPSILS